MTVTGDPVAARVHWRAAERHWSAAERFRQSGLHSAEAAARRCAKQQEDLAEMLEGGSSR